MTQFTRLFNNGSALAARTPVPEPEPEEPSLPLSEVRQLIDSAHEDGFAAGRAEADAMAQAQLENQRADFSAHLQRLVEHAVAELQSASAAACDDALRIASTVVSGLLTADGGAMVQAGLADHLSAILRDLVAHGVERVTVEIGQADAAFLAARAPAFPAFCASKGITLATAGEDGRAHISFDGGNVEIDVEAHVQAALAAVQRRLQLVRERTS